MAGCPFSCRLIKEHVAYIDGETKEKRVILSRLGLNLIWNEEKLSIINAEPIQKLIDALTAVKAECPEFEPANVVDTSEQNGVFTAVCPLLCVGEDLNLRSPFGRWIYSPLHLTALPPTQ